MAKGLSNNNPGNIRISGTRYQGEIQPSKDRAFKQFESMAYGYRAMFMLLYTYQKRHGLRTIRQMISRWAPPTENHTDNYIACIAEWSGTGVDIGIDTLTKSTMVPVVAAMSRMENGIPAMMADVEAGWQLFIGKP
ncbi:MAG: structural protein P5 [Rikenellaceae bacterium]|nr:structural protein P5 [Rikenellaceae bacterium]